MKTFEVPDLSFNYIIGQDKITLDPIWTCKKIDEILESRKGCTNYEHLDDFAAWIQETKGVILSPAVADWLMDSIRSEVYREKKERMDGLLSFSPPTPDSTPPA